MSQDFLGLSSPFSNLSSITNMLFFTCRDLAVMDEEGYGYIVGRLRDMLIRGGENIYPTEIEGFLHTHPKIADVQVSDFHHGIFDLCPLLCS